MKAYICQQYIDYCSLVVFAETSGKARYIAMTCDELGDDLTFMDIHVRRVPALDKYYRGENILDWYNDQDRIAMVRDAGFVCDDDSFDPDDCKRCAASEYCDKYQEYLEEMEEEDDG